MKEIVCVFVAGGVGSVARFLVGVWSVRAFGAAFPWGTLTVNALGSFAMGVVVTLASRGLPELWRLALATGLLGGFTTYSSFNQETLSALGEGDGRRAFVYVAGTIALCLLAGWLGARAARAA
jgi:CrcB protein